MHTNNPCNGTTLVAGLLAKTSTCRRHFKRPAVWLLFAMCLLCSIATPGHAASPWQIDDLAVLVDQQGSERIESISQPSRSADFEPVPSGFSAGYTRSVHWLRFTLQAPPPDAQGRRETLLEIQPPYVDDLQIYLSQPQGAGRFDFWQGGDIYPQSTKQYPFRGFVYRIVFEDDNPRTAYVRLQTLSNSVLMVRAWNPEQFRVQSAREYAFLGVLFGLLAAGLAANLWQGLWRREEIYRRYIAFLLATLFNLLGINGLVGELVFPEVPFWANHSVPLGLVCVVIFGTRFYMLALDIAHAAPWMRRVYRTQLGLAVLCLPSPFLDLYPEAIKVLLSFVLLTMLTGTWRIVQLWQQQNENAKPLLLTHLFILGGNLLGIPTLFGLLPGHFWLVYGFQFRSVATLLVLQLMLAKNMRSMQTKLGQASANIAIAQQLAQQQRAEHERQQQFLSMLTHELKTPLSIIRMRLGATAPTERMQAHAFQAVKDIDAIVERVAMASQIDEVASQPCRAPCRVNEILDEILVQQQPKQPVHVQITDNVLAAAFQSDCLLLRTILGNLIDNAVKYSPSEGTVQIAVALSLEANSKGVCKGVRIRIDNAPTKAGLPDHGRVFEKYYRTPGAHQQSGSGLGLYIARALAMQLGGMLRYRPLANRVIFELWLPL